MVTFFNRFRCSAVLLYCGIAAIGFPTFARAHSPHDHIEAFELGPGNIRSEDVGWADRAGFVMLIVVRGNLWRSGDGGASWKRIVQGLDNRHEIIRIGREEARGELVWVLSTKDGIDYWSIDGWFWARAGKSEVFPGSSEAIEFDASGSGLTDERITSVLEIDEVGIFVVTWNDGVFFSSNGGRNWERRAKGLTTDPQGDRRGLPQFTTLRRAPNGDLFLAGYDGLFRSRDDGRNWEEIETLPETLLIDFSVSPDYGEDQELAAITYWKGALRSNDGGETWESISRNVAPSAWDHLKRKLKGDDEYAHIARFHSIAFSPDYGEDGTIFAGLRNWFLISPDRGDHWKKTELTQFAAGEDVIPDRLVFSDQISEDRTLFFCSRLGEGKTRRGGVFKSTDGGRTFSLVHEAEGKYMQSLVISPQFSKDGTILVCSARGAGNSKVFRSTDGGKTWESVTGKLEFEEFGAELAISPDFVEDRTMWAGTERGFWRSLNGGDTWDRIDSGAFFIDSFVDMISVSPDFANDRTLIVTVKGRGALRSVDGGETFEQFRPDLFGGNHQFNRLWSYSPGRMLKFAPDFPATPDLFGMTGEKLFRLGDDTVSDLPIRETAATLGEVSLLGFWIAMAGAAAALVLAARALIRRRFLKQTPVA